MTTSDTEIAGKTGTRSQKIIRTSIVGIAANVLLAAFKAAVGLLANLRGCTACTTLSCTTTAPR